MNAGYKRSSYDDIHIAFFLPSLQLGGIERVTLNLAQGMADIGYKVDIVLVKAEGSYIDLVPSNVRVIDLNVSRVAFCLPRLIAYLRSKRPSHLITAQDFATPFALFATRFLRVKPRNIVVFHGMMSHTIKSCPLQRYAFVPRLIKYSSRWVDAFIAVSNNTADNVACTAGINRDQIEIIYNPVILPGFFESANEPVNHPWFKDGQPPVIISAGRLVVEKNYSSLIKAFANITKNMDAHLVILGEGEERHKLESLIKELGISSKVFMPGYVQNPASYISKASVFVLSSIHDSLPTALIEALALGTPIIATDCPGGIREILKNGLYGELVLMADSEALANSLLSVINNERKLDSCDVFSEFTIDTVLDKYLNVIFAD